MPRLPAVDETLKRRLCDSRAQSQPDLEPPTTWPTRFCSRDPRNYHHLGRTESIRTNVQSLPGFQGSQEGEPLGSFGLQLRGRLTPLRLRLQTGLFVFRSPPPSSRPGLLPGSLSQGFPAPNRDPGPPASRAFFAFPFGNIYFAVLRKVALIHNLKTHIGDTGANVCLAAWGSMGRIYLRYSPGQGVASVVRFSYRNFPRLS